MIVELLFVGLSKILMFVFVLRSTHGIISGILLAVLDLSFIVAISAKCLLKKNLSDFIVQNINKVPNWRNT